MSQGHTFKENNVLVLEQSASKAASDVLGSCQPVFVPLLPTTQDFVLETEYN